MINKYWMSVFIASFFEVLWVIGLKHSTHLWEWCFTALSIAICFGLLMFANQKLPIGTTYTVFAGLGTFGTVMVGILFFKEPFSVTTLALICILMTGVIGLKMVTKETEMQEERV